MRLGLIGWPVEHSLSPGLYKGILGNKLERYDLLSFDLPSKLPSLDHFARDYDGLNITSPYKEHFIKNVQVDSDTVRALSAINTLSFSSCGVKGTNTDVIAIEEILKNYQEKFSRLNLLVLGGGVMARVTALVARSLSIEVNCFSRSSHGDISSLDFSHFRLPGHQAIIINACSRDFVFKGRLSREDIFWDYNYFFGPHSERIPALVKSYEDGQKMLKLQALAAVRFWYETNPKLKC